MFKKKRILVTGAAGFIGVNLARHLLKKNFEVHILVKKGSKLWRIADIKDSLRIHYNDLSNLKPLRRMLHKINPQYIIHLAAHGSYPFQKNAQKMINTNIMGTYNLLEAAKEIPYKCFVNTGSSSEYGLRKKPMQEKNILEPLSFYAATKASTTLLCQVFARVFNKPIVTLRLFSVYGPYEAPTRLIPVAMKAALTGTTLKLTNGNIRHDFVFVDDIVRAYFQAMNSKKISGEIFNIGTSKQYTNIQVANTIKKISKKGLQTEIGTYEPRAWDINFWVADISKSKSMLKWKPLYSLEEGMKKTYSWFSRNLNLYQ